MAFRPFGFSFDLRTPLDVRESKRRIRDCKQVWYDPSDGPRGFVLGRLICLWNSAFDRQGPIMIGWLSDDATGCRISGRSGSDINGILYLTLVVLTLPVIAFGLSQQSHMDLWAGSLIGLCAVSLILLMWDASRNRDAGLVLVRFVELAIGSEARHEFR